MLKSSRRTRQIFILLILPLIFSVLWVTSPPSRCLENDNIIETDSIETFQPYIKGNGSRILTILYGQQNRSLGNASTNHFFIDTNRRFDKFANITQVKTYGYSTSNIRLKFEKITPQNFSKIIEEDSPDGYVKFFENSNDQNLTVYASFTLPMSCHLDTVQILVYVDGSFTLRWAILNSTWNSLSNTSYPDKIIKSGETLFETASSLDQFFLSLNINVTLLTNETDNNTFFIRLEAEAGPPAPKAYDFWWYCVNDATDGENEEDVWISNTYNISNIDMVMDLNLQPLDLSLSPSEINLQVNGTQVPNSGIIELEGVLNNSESITFNITSLWNITFDLNYLMKHDKDSRCLTRFLADADTTTVFWNVSPSETFPSTFTNCSVTFKVPKDWNVSRCWNITDIEETPITAANWKNITLYVYDNWRIEFTSPNYVKKIDSPSPVIIDEENSFLILLIPGAHDWNGTLTFLVYNSSDNILYYNTSQPTNNKSSLGIYWTPDKSFTNGTYIIATLFLTGFEAGYLYIGNVLFVYSAFLESHTAPYYCIGENATVKVKYVDKVHDTGIEGATVWTTWNNQVTYFKDEGEGIYAANLTTKGYSSGNHSLTVYAQKTGYEDAILSFNITFVYSTNVSMPNETIIGNYETPLTITIYYTDINGTHLENATVIGYIGTSKYIFEYNGTAYINITTFHELGTYNMTIQCSKESYEPKEINITIRIMPKKTNLDVLCPKEIEAGQQFTISINYTDQWGNPITHFNGTIYLNESVLTIFSNSSTIYFNITQYVGNYSISIMVNCPNHETKTWKGYLTIYGKMKITYQPQVLKQYENETITIHFNIIDSFRNTPLENCSITLTVNNHKWLATFNYQNYSCTLNLTGLQPGNYSINVVIEAPYYLPQTLEIPLYILPKTRTILTVNVPQEVTAGNTILISGTLTTENKDPIGMATIKIIVLVTYKNGTKKQFEYETVTNTKGEFSYTIPTNNEMSKIQITVVYEGMTDKTSAHTTYNITIKPSISTSKSLLPRWLTTIILITSIIFIGTFGYISKRKHKIKTENKKLLREYELILELNSLESLLVVDKESGRCIFEYSFKKTPTDPNIVAGFVQAVRGFYSEIGGTGEGEIGEIYYETPEPKVLTFHSGKYAYSILIAPGKLLPEIKESLRNFLDKFEDKFEKNLKTNTFEISIFDKAKNIVKESFPKHIFTKYEVTEIPPRIRGIKRKILKVAKEITEIEGSFTIAKLLTEVTKKEKINPLKTLKTLKILINQKIIHPTEEQN